MKRLELKKLITEAVEAFITEIYKEWEYTSGSMEYIEFGNWGVYFDYEHKGFTSNGSLIDLEIDYREVWSSRNEEFKRMRDLLNKK